MPLLPFAPAIIKLNEARIRMEDVNSQQAAGVLTELTKDVARVRARVEAGLNGAGNTDALKVSKDSATRGADSVDGLRNSVTTVVQLLQRLRPALHVVDGHAVQAARRRAQGIRRVPARQGRAGRYDLQRRPSADRCRDSAGRAPKLNEVPDLNEIIALPQDEMRDVVQRFIGRRRPRRTRRGATALAPDAAQYYRDWLAALKTLDFDTLSRNAQVDYLYIRKTANGRSRGSTSRSRPTRRARPTTPASRAPRAAASGLVFDLADEMIPYTPEQLIALAEQGIRVVRGGDEEGVARRWASATTGRRRSRSRRDCASPPGGQPRMITRPALRSGRVPARERSDHRARRSPPSRCT